MAGLVLAGLCAATGRAAESHSLRALAVTGDPAPGLPPPSSLEDLSQAAINAEGRDVAFLARIRTGSGSGTAIYRHGPGGFSLVARQGDPAPGTDGRFGELRTTSVTADGAVLVQGAWAPIDAPQSAADGIWLRGAEGFEPVAYVGGAAPGMTPGAKFTSLSSLALVAGGNTAFSGVALGLAGTGIWAGKPGGLKLVAATARPAPGIDGFFVSTILTSLDQSGTVAFWSLLAGDGVTAENNVALWSGGPGALEPVARSGDPAPGTGAGVRFGGIGLGLGLADANDAGLVAFAAGLNGTGVVRTNDSGVWAGPAGNARLVVRAGQRAPGTPLGTVFGGDLSQGWAFGDPVINARGESVFLASLVGPDVSGENRVGLWLGRPGDVRLIARAGEPAPGLGDQVRFGQFVRFGANGLGQVVFKALLAGPGIGAHNNQSVWLWTRNGLSLIARTGQAMNLGSPEDPDWRGSHAIELVLEDAENAGGRDGRPSPLSDGRGTVMVVRFVDGSAAVMLAVPLCAAPTLDFERAGAGVNIAFLTQIDCWYRLESASDLDSPTWAPVGSAILGNGEVAVVEVAAAEAKGFCRVVVWR